MLNMVMWWVKVGHVPALAQAKKEKLKYLNANGSTPKAFSIKDCYTPDGKPLIWKQPEKECA
ncbi:MAG: DUF3291 domain-containing protein [Robiginitomaculum sp.]